MPDNVHVFAKLQLMNLFLYLIVSLSIFIDLQIQTYIL